MIIGLTGLPRSGKDTVAQYLEFEYGFTRLAFADPLKQAAAVLLDRPLEQMHGKDGFDREAVLPEWGFSTRWFLQVLGTECLRQQVRADFWIQRMRNVISEPGRIDGRFVITDCRFPNEVDLVHEFGGQVVEVVRPGTRKSSHVSDAGVPSDRRLDNSRSIEELYSGVDYLITLLSSHAATTSRPARTQP